MPDKPSLNTIFLSFREEETPFVSLLQKLITESFQNLGIQVHQFNSPRFDSGVPAGQNWKHWILKAANADEHLFVLGDRPSEWMYWEMGAAAMLSVNKHVRTRGTGLKFYPNVFRPPQLSDLMIVDARSVTGLVNLFSTWNAYYDNLSNASVPKDQIEEFVADVCSRELTLHNAMMRKHLAIDDLDAALSYTIRKNHSTMNCCIRSYLSKLSRRAKKLREEGQLIAPYVQYLGYLEDFLSYDRQPASSTSIKPSVNAVAVIGEVESFWNAGPADRLAILSKQNTKRLFIFKDKEQFRSHYDRLNEHRKHYSVRLLWRDNIAPRLHIYRNDFSILKNGDKDPLLAIYQAPHGRPVTPEQLDLGIAFDSDSTSCEQYQDAFDQLWKISKDWIGDATQEQLEDQVFGAPLNVVLDTSGIEMSGYIEPAEYDQFEPDHVFYGEMLECMAGQIRDRRGAGCRILELGVGTGHLTTRLLRQSSTGSEIAAVEFDKKYYDFFCQKFNEEIAGGRVKPIQENSSCTNPDGTFDFVFSSFADSHIKPRERAFYYRNVVNNIAPDGYFVVGDEFLREPIEDDPDTELKHALHAWHGFVIEDAKRRGKLDLARIEDIALNSGLDRKGDHKVPRSIYRRTVADAGLEIIDELCIGPQGWKSTKQIGGVFVMIMTPRQY